MALESVKLKPTERFSGLADAYALARPTYPSAALDFIMSECSLSPGCIIADIGCGTGISSRLIANRGVRVLGIEPNADMRKRAEAEPLPAGSAAVTYAEGSGESTDLQKGTMDAVLSAQAFHWLDSGKALREFHRILKPGTWAILMWNLPDESHDFTREFIRVIGSQPARRGLPLLSTPLFTQARCTVFPNEQSLDEEGLLLRAISSSFAPGQVERTDELLKELQALFSRFANGGRVVIKYQTFVYTGRRVDTLGVPLSTCAWAIRKLLRYADHILRG